ncbi:TolC family protein [Variovorax sp. J22P168]|uniref:TolC family protein n=1 Tax=Variovorax jilinensis TaxID=3053513 RepID=UPI00257716C0|nr:TolC family protein [Variovorax sp. J22P168]MDM0011755.1 TolC family protein [Variovorax sp. J22P168]
MLSRPPARWPVLSLVLAATLLAAGCGTVDIDQALRDTDARTAAFTRGDLSLARTPEQRAARAALADSLLSAPLSEDDAVRLALVNSPALQALLAERWAELAAADQAGRPVNPLFKFERLRLGDELEIGRLLSVGLVDLLLLPQRLSLSKSLSEQARLQLAASVVDQVTQVRQAWVRAVAAGQSLAYAKQVAEAADAGAELARRMQQAGNFSRLQQARQQVFEADAGIQRTQAEQAAVASREALVRVLGLDDAQAARLVLPPRLPELPRKLRDALALAADAGSQRIDLQLARARLDAAAKSQGLDLVPSFVDAELGGRHDSVFAGDTRATRSGWELDIRLPLFDLGTSRRDALDAQALAALNRYQATARGAASQLREDYAGYRSAWALAQRHRDEILPLRQRIAEENLLRYNGMLIGVFELLAETREQIAGVRAAIDAEQQFWLADAALAASLIGRPPTSTTTFETP